MRRAIHSGAAGILGLAAVVVTALHLLSTPARADALRIDTPEGPRNALLFPVRPLPAPTVLVLHGAVSNAAWTVRHYGFVEAAAARGFSAVFPDGAHENWNDGRGRFSSRADDVTFLRLLVGELVDLGVARPDRIYIAGISSGGMMALRMVCEAAELFAGAGTVIASMPVATGAGCRPRRPVPIVMFNGTADRLVPYAGGGVGPLALGGFVWGAERTAAFLARANGCAPGAQVTDTAIARTSVTRMAWSGCAEAAGVTLYRINGGRHRVEGRRRLLPALLGIRRDQLSAAQTIMAAFAGE